jgi:aminoglycoside phosphotransferase (APT) family kinase protein
MSSDHILNLARQVNPRAEPNNIIELSGGFSSQAYKIDIPGNPFVLLVERPGAVSQANYGHAYAVLTLLQKHELKHAPLPLWLQEDHNALAISFFDGVASDTFDFEQTHIDTKQLSIDVIDNLFDTSVITMDEYQQLTAELNVKAVPIATTQEAARKYGSEWFEIVRRSCPDQAIITWLGPRIKQMHILADELGTDTPILGHGDPSNPNILVNKEDQFMLIDWDSARFHTTGPEFLVAYTTDLTDFMKPYRQALIEHAAHRLDIPVSEFADKVHEYSRFSGIGDVNWAAMMMAKVNSGEVEGDIDHFRKIAVERIALYEKSFGA